MLMTRVPSSRQRSRLCLGVLIALATVLSACTSASLQQRAGYWADESLPAQAYNQRVRFLVMHYTGGDEPRAVQVLTGPSVSSHYLVAPAPPAKGGAPIVRQLVPESARAWHAGTSSWRGRHHLNDSSIGIEIVNAGPLRGASGSAWQGFGGTQMQAVIALSRDIISRYDISPQNVVGHSDISPGRKVDPGPAFPWEMLYRNGIGAWPDDTTVAAYRSRFASNFPTLYSIQTALARYGYDIPVTGVMDQRTHAVVVSFQMHFRPARYDGIPDLDTVARLWALNEKYR